MSVSSSTSRIVYAGNNSLVTAYAVPFYFEANAHLNAIAKTAAGVETVVTLTNHTGAGNENGGTVRTAVAVPATSTLTIYREVPFTQATSYEENDAFPAASHERALDKLTTITQQLERRITNCIRGTEATPLSPIPSPTGTQQFVLSAASNQPPSWQELPVLAAGPVVATGSTQARFISDRFADVVNVKDFGAVGDGVADDTAALQAAIIFITNANKKGAKIQFPVGTYKITSTITITHPMIFEGVGNSCVIAPNFASGDLFIATSEVDLNKDDGVQFFNIHFKASVVKTSGYYININGASFTSIKQCKFFNGYNGVGITGTASANTRVKDCHFANNTNFNVNITAVSATGQGSVDIVLEDLWINGQSDAIQSAAGVRVTSAGDLTLRHVSTVFCGNGLLLVPPGGSPSNRIQAMFVAESFFDSGSGYGIYAQGKIDLLSINQTWACTNKKGGILLSGLAGEPIRQVDLVNVVASNNQAVGGAGNGLLFGQYASNISVVGGSFSNNAGSGIAVFANTTNFKIIGATCGTCGEFPGNQQYGIYVDTGASDGYAISNNQIFGNIVGQLFDGGTGLTKTTYPNIGAGSAITTNATQSTDWGVDFAKQGAVLVGASPYVLGVGSGLVMLHHNGSGNLALYLACAGTVTKVSGAANLVSGAAALNQIGLAYNSGPGKYEVSNGYATPQDVFICTLKTRSAS